MDYIIKEINLNVRQPNNFQLITAMQNDNETIKVIATLYDGNNLYSIQDSIDNIRLTGRTANNQLIDVVITEYTEHTISFVLSKNMLSSNGDLKLSVVFSDSETNQILSAYPFTIKVHDAPIGTLSQTELTTLDTYITNAKEYMESAKEYADSWKGSLLPKGEIAFSDIPINGMVKGYMYCINESFETDSRFEEGADFFYPAGTCIYWTENNQWKCLSGVLSRKISQAEYDSLTDAQKNNGTIYYIEDGDNLLKEATITTNGLMSANDKNKLDNVQTGAEVNQNAFSNVVVGSTTISADSKTDSLTLVGSNVTLTPDATNNKVTIGITKSNVTSALGYTPPTTNTTYGVATTSSNGLMSASDKSKLDGITSGANVKFISVTQAQYDALSSPETNVIYFITDAS